MTRPTTLLVAGILAIIAIGLIGYTVYNNNRTIAAYEAQIDDLRSELSEKDQDRSEFYFSLIGSEVQDQIAAIAAAPDLETRQRIATEIEISLKGLPAVFPDGYYVLEDVKKLAAMSDPILRENEVENVQNNISDIGSFGLEPEASVVIDASAVSALSGAVTGLITTIGGVASGLVSLLMFVVGGGKRRIEEEMLSVDLEMKRVELAKAQFAAKEAIAATNG